MIRLVMLAALAASAPLSAQSAPAPSQVATPERATAAAMRFAELYVPQDTAELGITLFRSEFSRSFRSIPSNVALDQRFPGTEATGIAAGERELRKIYVTFLPDVRRKVAARVSRDFSDADLTTISDFLASGAGQKVLGSLTGDQALKNRDLIAQARAGSVTVTEDMLAKVVDPAAIAKMTDAELQATATFMATPPAVKFREHGVALGQLVADEAMVAVKAGQPEMQAEIARAIRAHVEKKR